MHRFALVLPIFLVFHGCGGGGGDTPTEASSASSVSLSSGASSEAVSSAVSSTAASSVSAAASSSSVVQLPLSSSSVSSLAASSAISLTASSSSATYYYSNSSRAFYSSASTVSSVAASSSSPVASSSSSAAVSSVAASSSSVISSAASSVSSSSSSVAVAYGCDVPAPAATETRPLLVVRINYNNITFRNSASSWSAKFFGTNMHQLNDYYRKISYGRFGFGKTAETDGVNDGIITVALDKNHPDPTFDEISTKLHPDLKAALIAANPYINFGAYDTNHNGAISPDELVIIFVVAGNEDAFSGENAEPGIWAHQFCTDPVNSPTLDGVSLMNCYTGGNYAAFGERHTDLSISYDADATVGVIAHELGHAAFNLPDLYDINNVSAGIGYFGLMSGGMWARDSASDLYGNTPVSMCAWSKLHNGWVAPTVISGATTGQNIVLNDTASSSYNVFLLPISSHECFLLENRSTSGYDSGLFDLEGYYEGGTAIWHIDQTVIDNGMADNTVNANAAHKGVDLEEAANAGLDTDYTFRGDARNLFYQGNKTSFTPTTTPNSRRYDGTDSGVSVTGVSYPGTTMQATVVNPN